jgi:hypothetical protein
VDKARILMEQLTQLKRITDSMDTEHGVDFEGRPVDTLMASSCRCTAPGVLAFDLVFMGDQQLLVWVAITLDVVRLFLVTTLADTLTLAEGGGPRRVEQIMFIAVLSADGRLHRYTKEDAAAIFTKEDEAAAREIGDFLASLD